MREKIAKKIKKIISKEELTPPLRRIYRRCKKAYARMNDDQKVKFMSALDIHFNVLNKQPVPAETN